MNMFDPNELPDEEETGEETVTNPSADEALPLGEEESGGEG